MVYAVVLYLSMQVKSSAKMAKHRIAQTVLLFWMHRPRTVMSRWASILSRGKVAFLAQIPVETARYTFLRQLAVNDDK